MGNVVNLLNIVGWSSILFLIASKFFINPTLYFKQDIGLEVSLVKLIQIFQLLDIALIIIGRSKGSLFGSIAQITGRLIVALIFLQNETDRYAFAHMSACWAIADLTRYLYYLTKNDLITICRYTFFIVLYPLGVWGEMKVINDYIKRNASPLTIPQIQMIRIVQVGILIGTAFLYVYMLKMRSKHFKSKSKEKAQK